MKRTAKKLELKKDTIRILQGSELSEVVGAGPTALCTQQGTGCMLRGTPVAIAALAPSLATAAS